MSRASHTALWVSLSSDTPLGSPIEFTATGVCSVDSDGSTSVATSSTSAADVDCDTATVRASPLSLYPCYFPSKSQLLALATVQAILESCCFDFAQKWMPELILQKRWDSAAAVDLQQWIHILGDCDMNNVFIDANVSVGDLPGLLLEMQNLRDIAVYRTRITSRGISQLLHFAQKLSRLLGDGRRAAMICQIKKEIDERIHDLESDKKFLESSTAKEIYAIEEQQATLKARRENVITRMLQLDIEKQFHAGLELEGNIKKVVQQFVHDSGECW